MAVDAIIARLQAETDLRTVAGASSLQRIMESGSVPQATRAAFVVPLGLLGGQADTATGLYRQTLTEAVGVILIRNAWGDRTGDRAADELQADIDAVIQALAGWVPPGAIDGLRLQRGQLVGSQKTAVVYQLDFGLTKQLRITR